jgi:hypothetical protein
MMTSLCHCTKEGYCPRYQLEMAPRLVELCQTRSDYRERFAELWGVHDGLSTVDARDSKANRSEDPCIHRSDKPINEHACRCIHKATFACASPSRGVPTCKVSDCTACEHYE